MRVTKDTLLKIANDFVEQRLRADRTLLGIYLQGSLLDDEPMLGGITDIDLFLVHSDAVAQARELVRISDEIHLDLAHHSRSQYRQPRELRRHTWLGHCINGGKILYDPQHFLDFTQASVRGQFDRADRVLVRSRTRLDHSRQIWLELQELTSTEPDVQAFTQFLRAVENAANAVAGLSGPPLTERRFLQQFPARGAGVQRPGLAAGLLGLLGASQIEAVQLRAWLPAWQADFQAVSLDSALTRLHPYRYSYYLRGIEALLDSPSPRDALWPLLRTWLSLASLQPALTDPGAGWHEAFQRLGWSGAGFQNRLEALDAYLDTIDELLEAWASEHGA